MDEIRGPAPAETAGEAGRCPACGAEVLAPPGVVLGEALWCGTCGVELEVRGTGPLLLDLYQDEEK
jgi:lysine biosynthesis protein LysW